jgi:prepilin-type N-terminal cleavage/methylation domain-containing protein
MSANTEVTNRRRFQSGLTLIELLLALTIAAILGMALAFAFQAASRLQRAHTARMADQDATDRTEREITRVLRGARITATATDTTTFFQGVSAGSQTDLGCDRLTLTTTEPGVPTPSQESADDFETQHQARGPVGGLSEVSIGTTPVGDANSHTGLFERIQRPSDGDPTQGGMESTLNPEISQIGFQFWNGTAWISSWDTVATADRRLPAAVQVSYRLSNATDDMVHVFVVAIPASNVTAANPDSAQGL